MLDPIADARADFVQGSRFLKRGANLGPMPHYRRVATRVHPLLFSLVARRWVTESTNGFRAIHRHVLSDPRIDLARRGSTSMSSSRICTFASCASATGQLRFR